MARKENEAPPGRFGSASLKARYGAFSILAGCGLLIAFVPPFLLDRGMRWVWKPPSDALMWWPAPSAYALTLIIVGLLASLILGLLGFAAGRVGKGGWRALAVLALLWLPAPFLASQAMTVVYPDRIETRGPWSRQARTLPLAEVASVHVGCSELSRGRRRSPVPTIAYVLSFGDGEVVDLVPGVRRRNAESVRTWLAAVDLLDASLAERGTAKSRLRDLEGDPGLRPMCLRALSASLGPADFERARRILMIPHADLYRYGLDPRGVW